MREITVRQAQVLIFIENFIQENNYSPTVRAITAHFKMTAKGAYDHITALIKKECITAQVGKFRTIRLNKKNSGGGK
jgi:repressor LexA